MLQGRGLSLAHPTEADYQANWCGWGYEMDFTPKQMLGTIPKLKELGLNWATLDAGWFVPGRLGAADRYFSGRISSESREGISR